MARWGRCNFKGLENLQKELEKIQKEEVVLFYEESIKELAARLLAKVIPRTPVGQYSDGMLGGTLRRGWTADKENISEKGTVINVRGDNGAVSKMEIKKENDHYFIYVQNTVDYASYVENGHRQEAGRFVPAIGKKLKKGWVEGKFMLKISEEELNREAPRILEKRLEKFLRRCFQS